MGGFGSTRWSWHRKATAVEDCRALTVFDMTRAGVIAPGVRGGGWVWSDSQTGEKRASISYQAAIGQTTGRLDVAYSITSRPDLGLVQYAIKLATTSPNFGGRRWWFICPLAGCGRRVGKLYLPEGGQYFGCRRCYGLTYRSSQESDKRVSALARLLLRDPEAALAGNRDPGGLLLLLKAYDKFGMLWGDR